MAVTGATGNVGRAVVERLVADRAVEEIVGVARRRPTWSPPRTTWYAVDVADDDLSVPFTGVDAVVHLAWMFQPTHRPTVTWRTNALGSIRVFDAAVAAGASVLVHASSVGAYAPGAGQAPVDESWPTHALPTAADGREKSDVERALDVVERDNPALRVVRLRPAFTFAAEAAPEQRRVFAGPLLPSRPVGRGWVPAVPLLRGLRFQTVHSDDVAEAYHLARTRPVRGAFNIAAEPILDLRRVAELLGRPAVPVPAWAVRTLVAVAWRLRLMPASPTLIDLFLCLPVMDTTRAHRELGWRPRRSSLQALDSFLQGLRHPAGAPTPPLNGDAQSVTGPDPGDGAGRPR